MSNNHTPQKKTWMRIAVLALAGLMMIGALALPFLR